jgi:membrane protease YdiL (CAAX protease family)
MLFTMIFGMGLGFLIYGADIIDYIKDGFSLTDPSMTPLLKYLQVINTLGLFVIPPFIYALLVSKKPWSYLGMDRHPGFHNIVMGTLLIIAVLPFLHWLAGINELLDLPAWLEGIESWMEQSEDQARQLTEMFLSTTTYNGLMINLLMIAVLPAIGEEFLFRGVLQRLFHEWSRNGHLAVILAALLFSALHLQFYGFLPRLLLGLFLGYLYLWSRSIWVPVLVHFFNNGIAVVAAWLYARGNIQTSAESLGEMPGALFIVLSLVISVLILFALWYGRNKKKGSTIE